jgi:creatinase
MTSSASIADLKDLLTVQNGRTVPHTFSAGEYQNRQTMLRRSMAEGGVDAVVFTSVQNINYYSDFLYCSFGRPFALVVTPEEVVSVSANIDGGQPWRRAVGDRNVVYTDWRRDNFFRALQQVVPNRGRVGVEFDHLSVERMEKFRLALPNVEITDISGATMRLRMLKSAEEIALIKNGAAVADVGGAALVAAIHEGVPEYEVALAATSAMVREIARLYPDSELMDTWTWFQSGLNTDGAHNPVTSRRVRRGDILSLNCFPMISGYYTALERTLFFDHCDAASLKLWQANVEAYAAGLQLVKPGVRCCDVAAQLNEIFAAHDLLKFRTFGYGHSFGVLSHYYGREASLEFREDVETVLAPNMVVSIEPMIMIPEGMLGAGGYREHDILVVTDTGAVNITGFPVGPEHNIIRR